jgi:pyruvate decarboxylase
VESEIVRRAHTPGCQAIVDWADLIVAAGPVFSDYTTVGWTAQPAQQRMISAEPQVVRFAGAEYTGVALADFLSDLAKKVQANDATLRQFHRLRGQRPHRPRPGTSTPTPN